MLVTCSKCKKQYDIAKQSCPDCFRDNPESRSGTPNIAKQNHPSVATMNLYNPDGSIKKHEFVHGLGVECARCGMLPIHSAHALVNQNQETAATGCKREKLYGPARYDLMMRNEPGIRRLAETWAEGNEKYGPDNWMKGFPISVSLNHALDHIAKYLAGDRSEDHLAHGAWNLLHACYIEEKKPELCDLTMPQLDGNDLANLAVRKEFLNF